jgi:hypothetical protein
MDITTQDRLLYVYTEYCPGDFFWGWWLYAIPVVDGTPIRDTDGAWLRHASLEAVLQALGLPESDWRNPETYNAFLAAYPNGALIRKDGRRYSLAEEQKGIELWRLLRDVREAQLLDWKNADESYLAWVERQKKEESSGKNAE